MARVVALARAHHIPVQYGVTGGGNDAAVYTRYGSNAVALGWPTKYSHSPAEESDTKDVYGLSRICTLLATQSVVRRIRQVRQCAIVHQGLGGVHRQR
ncbi:Peptidase M42 [mine drainage metagenome]|uniref:Peptidase M42 n=1 Tax=mine drainage metagenome TaxID=410659 RepID=T1B538_9ZZZZ